MGYTTDFSDKINVVPPVSDELKNYINTLSLTRRMKRDVNKLIAMYGGEYGYNGTYGEEGEFFAKDDGQYGQSNDDSIINYNHHPDSQHSLWLDWIITDDGKAIEWNGNEKFYSAEEWMRYIIDSFLAPNGHVCNGRIHAEGEDRDDVWELVVSNNTVTRED